MNTLKYGLFILVFSCSIQKIHAQQEGIIHKHTIYVEAMNHTPWYFLNYDHIFKVKPNIKYSYHIGASVFSNIVGISTGIHVITGTRENHAEFGLTISPFVVDYQKLFDSGNLSDKKGYIIPSIGYRYQKPEGGLFIKTTAAVFILVDPPSDNFWKMDGKLLGGGLVAVGYNF